MAIFTLKSIVANAKRNQLPAYVCYLDATAAFDKVSHEILIRRLVDSKVPSDIVKLLVFWFDNQYFRIRWNFTDSAPFPVRRGVRQGGVLSAYFFAYYMDTLSHRLKAAGMGCMINGNLINHICYADDICLLASSIAALRLLLEICRSFAASHDLEFNPDKTMLQCFLPPHMNHLSAEVAVPFGKSLLYHTQEVKYLGCIIEAKHLHRNHTVISNDKEFEKRCADMYKRAYMIKSWFKKCSAYVKSFLFKTYLSSIYCSSLWDLNKGQLKRFKVVYNSAVRIVFGYGKFHSVTHVIIDNDLKNYLELLQASVESLQCRLACSDNQILQSIYHSSSNYAILSSLSANLCFVQNNQDE